MLSPMIYIAAAMDDRIQRYARALSRAGAIPVCYGSPEAREIPVEGFDGLVLPGGVDVDPGRYGQVPHPTVVVNPALDDMQFAALEAFLPTGRPILGICRGHQLLNVAFGGTLIQHLDTVGTHRGDEDVFHDILCEGDSFLSELYGREFRANSSHHQAVDRPGRGFAAVARARDGTVEAMAHECGHIWSVQYHPERLLHEDFPRAAAEGCPSGLALMRFFTDRCRRDALD